MSGFSEGKEDIPKVMGGSKKNRQTSKYNSGQTTAYPICSLISITTDQLSSLFGSGVMQVEK